MDEDQHHGTSIRRSSSRAVARIGSAVAVRHSAKWRSSVALCCRAIGAQGVLGGRKLDGKLVIRTLRGGWTKLHIVNIHDDADMVWTVIVVTTA